MFPSTQSSSLLCVVLFSSLLSFFYFDFFQEHYNDAGRCELRTGEEKQSIEILLSHFLLLPLSLDLRSHRGRDLSEWNTKENVVDVVVYTDEEIVTNSCYWFYWCKVHYVCMQSFFLVDFTRTRHIFVLSIEFVLLFRKREALVEKDNANNGRKHQRRRNRIKLWMCKETN